MDDIDGRWLNRLPYLSGKLPSPDFGERQGPMFQFPPSRAVQAPYSMLAALKNDTGSDDGLHVLRRFQAFHARLLLDLQARIAEGERELETLSRDQIQLSCRTREFRTIDRAMRNVRELLQAYEDLILDIIGPGSERGRQRRERLRLPSRAPPDAVQDTLLDAKLVVPSTSLWDFRYLTSDQCGPASVSLEQSLGHSSLLVLQQNVWSSGTSHDPGSIPWLPLKGLLATSQFKNKGVLLIMLAFVSSAAAQQPGHAPVIISTSAWYSPLYLLLVSVVFFVWDRLQLSAWPLSMTTALLWLIVQSSASADLPTSPEAYCILFLWAVMTLLYDITTWRSYKRDDRREERARHGSAGLAHQYLVALVVVFVIIEVLLTTLFSKLADARAFGQYLPLSLTISSVLSKLVDRERIRLPGEAAEINHQLQDVEAQLHDDPDADE